MKFIAQRWRSDCLTKQSLTVVLVLSVGILIARAQGTLEFSVDLAGPTTGYTGEGVLALTDQLLAYTVYAPVGFAFAEIRGPGPDADAPIIFQLGYRQGSIRLDNAYCTAIGPGGVGGGCTFSDAEAITESQAAELVSGQWHVWAHSPTAPSFPISGQIVPEPTVTALLLLGLLAISVRMLGTIQK